MVTLTELPDGTLRLTIDKSSPYWADDLETLIERHGGNNLAFLAEAFDTPSGRYTGNDWWVLQADQLPGNLSQAPCIAYDALWADENDEMPDDFGKVWFFKNYQIDSIAETLRDNGEVIFHPLRDTSNVPLDI